MTNVTNKNTAHQSNLAWMRDEYTRKEALLGQAFGDAVDPAVYNDVLFHHDHEAARVVVWTGAEPGNRIHRFMTTADMLQACQGRRDAAVAPAGFYRDVRKKAMLRQLHALTIDLDGVASMDLQALIQDGFTGLTPTYVVNSGRGLHLVYAFDTPVEAFDWAKAKLEAMLTALKKRFSIMWLSYHVDQIPSLIQIYRVVGSRTKLGQTCRAYRVGEPYKVDVLANDLGVTWAKPQHQRVTGYIRDHGNVYTLPTARTSFYTCVRDGIIARTMRGHRHTSLFALAVVAVKCRVPEDVLKADAARVVQAFNHRDPQDPVPDHDIDRALGSVDPQEAKNVRSETIERWVGWTFERRTKRNGRSRQEHLTEIAHVASAAARSGRARDAVVAYLTSHPDATTTDIMTATKLSRPTVTKYAKAWRQHREAACSACTVTHDGDTVSAASVTAQDVPTGVDREEYCKKQLAATVATIMDPATAPRTRARLLRDLPPDYRKIVVGWLT